MNTAVAPARRIKFRNVLFATDFSPASQAALPFAADMAQRFGASVFVVHAKAPQTYALPATAVWPAMDAYIEMETKQFQETFTEQFPGIKNEFIALDGDVWGVIEKVAKDKNADLIVVGTRGRRGIGKFLLGSAAEEILRRATCPVLTVGPYAPAAPPREGRFRKILFATDFGNASRLAADYALTLAQEHQAHLTLLHVIEHAKVGDLVGPHELESAALNQLRALVPEGAELWCEPHTMVREGVPADEILETAERENADLIVIGVHNATGIGSATHLPVSVAHRVISHANCPVLTVRA